MDTAYGREPSVNNLQRSATLLQMLLGQSKDMITVSDRAGNIVYANPATEHVSGYTIAEFSAQHPFETIHPHDRAHCEAAFARLLVTPELSIELEHRIRHKDGTWRWVMGTLTSLYHDPTVNGLVAIIRDITDRKRAEEQFRHLSESGLMSIAYFRATGEIFDANDAFLAMVGYTRDELREGQVRWDKLTPPEWLPRTHQGLAEFQQSGIITPYEKEYFRRDGSRFWGLFGGAKLTGAVEGIAFILDIDERKRAEEALSASEERYRTLFEAIDEGFCTIEVLFDMNDKPIDYRFLDVNPTFEQQTGLRNAAGQTARHLVPDLEEFWFEMYGRIALTGEPVRFEQHAAAMQRWFDVYTFRIGQPEERKVAIWFKDVTTRKQAEEDLRVSEERFRAVADLVPDLLWSNGANGAIDWYNQSWFEYTGQTLDQTRGNSWLDAIHPEDRAASLQRFELAIERGEAMRQEFRIRSAEGTYRWFLAQARPVHAPSGEAVRWYGAATDIHQELLALAAEQEARNEAESALQTRDQFLSIASHELRSPLTAIIGYAQMLHMRTVAGKPASERMISMLLRQSERLQSMIEQMLDVSRLQQGQFMVELQPIDLVSIAVNVIDDFRILLPSDYRHSIVFMDVPPSITILGDAHRLEQVMVNLLSNAVKYSPDGGEVHVRLTQTGTAVRLEVEDHGIGIPVDVRDHLFEPFYRAGNIGDQISGFGLGLHIVREIVQRHSGHIEVESTEGKGSTFRVVLPLLAADDATG